MCYSKVYKIVKKKAPPKPAPAATPAPAPVAAPAAYGGATAVEETTSSYQTSSSEYETSSSSYDYSSAATTSYESSSASYEAPAEPVATEDYSSSYSEPAAVAVTEDPAVGVIRNAMEAEYLDGTKPLNTLNLSEIERLLANLNLTSYNSQFQDNEISGKILAELSSEEELLECEITMPSDVTTAFIQYINKAKDEGVSKTLLW